MAAVKEVIFRIRPKTKEAEASLKRMTEDTKNFDTQIKKSGRSVDSFGKSIAGVGKLVAGAFAVQQVIAFGRASVAAFDVQQKSQQKLLVALKQNEEAQKRLITQAAELQKVTIFGDEDIINAQAFLATMGLTENAIKRLTPFVLDLATKQGTDLRSAADLIAKSVGSSTNALSRYGIQIEGTVGSSERLESAIEALNEQVGGQAEAAAKVGTGALQQIENRVGDLQERIGEMILKGIDPFVDSINDVIDIIEDLLPLIDKVAEKPAALISLPTALFSWIKALVTTEEQVTSLDESLAKMALSQSKGSKETEVSIVTVESLKNEIKKLKDEYEKTDITTKRFTQIQDELKKKENELKIVTGELTDAEKKRREELKKAAEEAEKIREQTEEDIKESQMRIEDLLASLITDDLLRQKTQLEIKAERDKEAAESSLALAEDISFEKFLIEENLRKDIDELNAEAARKDSEAKSEELEKEKEQAKKIKEVRRKAVEDVTRFTIDTFGKALDIRTQQLDFEIDAQRQRIQTATELAEQGNVAQLKAEQKRLDDLNRQRRKAFELQKALAAAEIAVNTALTISNIALSVAKTGAQSGVASPATIPITLAAIGGGLGIAATLYQPPAFAEGTEMVKGAGSETSDSITARLSRGERVVSAKKNKQYWSALTAIHNGTIPAQEMNDFVNNYTFERKRFDNKIVLNNPNDKLEKKLDGIADILKRKGNTSVSIDENGIYMIVDRIKAKGDRMRKFLA